MPLSRDADTIAAVATAAGPGGVGIVRLSGPNALVVAARVASARVSPQEQPPQTLRRAVVRDPATGEEIDDILLAVFRAPNSFTGEDVAELQGHGGDVTLGRVLAACLRAGARAARPGEFSERAFLNGRIDLSQAEGVAALVAAQTVAAQRAARRQVAGELSRAVAECGDHLRDALARIEASIDFPEEVGEIDRAAVDRALESAQGRVGDLLATFDYGRRLSDGVTVVLVGRPNVGKSSLLNALSGRERAIVTEVAGTTRDVIEEALNFNGVPVRALDTAGIRETEDPVERIGVARAREAVETADVVVAVLDATTGWTPGDARLLEELGSRPLVVAANKADAADPGPTVAAARAALTGRVAEVVATAAPEPGGIEPLRSALGGILGSEGAASASPAVVISARHAAALGEAERSLAAARRTLGEEGPAELIAVDAHGALQSLGQITGETAREEVIAGIFSRFCIGK
ncbi:MAG TPA: tRNA uridine-5-carboxymethylaminomethyl(34) synthesis GTPase MnmE [Armatimonadaceae bacterium]|nr:tRNA uridine-5-carboxymethylaminomethyl(34) synthesis GTPase MnmE [Armatimonadaceae bacterium]